MIVTTFPRTVRVIEHTLIPLKDGTMLAARSGCPTMPNRTQFPAILEYLCHQAAEAYASAMSVAGGS